MTKRVTPHIVVLLFSFFIFLSRPYADTISFPILSYTPEYSITDYFTFWGYDIRDYVSDWMNSESFNSGREYIIYSSRISGNNVTYWVLTFPSSYTSVDSLRYRLSSSYGNDFTLDQFGTMNSVVIAYRVYGPNGGGIQPTNWSSLPDIRFFQVIPENDTRIPIYSSVPLLCTSSCVGNTFIFSYDNKIYTAPKTGDDYAYVPTLDFLYNYWYGDPPDNYPLLTDFFTLFIDKITYVSEYFVSNYIYLYMFSLFIFFSFILLLKRRLF